MSQEKEKPDNVPAEEKTIPFNIENVRTDELIPKFSTERSEFLVFIKAFDDLVHNTDASDKIKFHVLMSLGDIPKFKNENACYGYEVFQKFSKFKVLIHNQFFHNFVFSLK